MNGIDIFQTFWRKGLFEIFSTNAIKAMASERLTPLIDKKPVFKKGLWGHPVFSNIQLKKMTGFRFKLYETKPIAFAQDTERL